MYTLVLVVSVVMSIFLKHLYGVLLEPNFNYRSIAPSPFFKAGRWSDGDEAIAIERWRYGAIVKIWPQPSTMHTCIYDKIHRHLLHMIIKKAEFAHMYIFLYSVLYISNFHIFMCPIFLLITKYRLFACMIQPLYPTRLYYPILCHTPLSHGLTLYRTHFITPLRLNTSTARKVILLFLFFFKYFFNNKNKCSIFILNLILNKLKKKNCLKQIQDLKKKLIKF